MTDEDKHLKVMIALAEINTTLIEVVKPAVDQVYLNKDDIIRMHSFQRIIKYIGGTTVGITVTIAGKMAYGLISKHH